MDFGEWEEVFKPEKEKVNNLEPHLDPKTNITRVYLGYTYRPQAILEGSQGKNLSRSLKLKPTKAVVGGRVS